MAGEGTDADLGEVVEKETPAYLKQVTDKKFLNISIKGYEKKASAGFTKEEYYAYRIISM